MTGTVSLKTYCTVFGATGNQEAVNWFCDEIFGERGGAWRTAPKSQSLYQGVVGDGKTQFPRPGDVPNGIERWYNFKYWNYLNDEPHEMLGRATFIAGAFGAQEIPLKPVDYSAAALGVFREDLPIELIEKLNTFYRECEANGLDVCMESKSAKEVARLWKPVQKFNRLEVSGNVPETLELSDRLDMLKNNFSFLEAKIIDRKDRLELRRSIVPYLDKLPKNPKTVEDYKIAINKYRGMVQLAIQIVYPDADAVKPVNNGIPTEHQRSNPFGNGTLFYW